MKLLDFLKTGNKFKFLKNTVQTKCELSEAHSSPWSWVSSSIPCLTPGSLLLQCQHLATRWGSRVIQRDFSRSGTLFPPGCIQTHTHWAALGNLFFLSSPVLTPTPAYLEAQAPSPRVYDAPALGPRPPVVSVSWHPLLAQVPTSPAVQR